MEQRLQEIGRVYGLAFGPYCEASASMEVMVRSLAHYRAPELQDEGDYGSLAMARGIAVQKYRRALAIASFKAQALWTRAVIERERPCRESVRKFNQFRERDAHIDRDAFAGKLSFAPLDKDVG